MTGILEGRTVLVTGANGGLGERFVARAIDAGATRVYAAARRPREQTHPLVAPLTLDVTDGASVARAVDAAPDVDLLVNNAGIAPDGDLISGPEEELRRIFETNFFGAVGMTTAFAPVLARAGGGTVLNVLSLATWIPVPTGYAASKAALWSATNSFRVVLEGQGTQVVALHVGMVDTAMSAGWDVPKVDADDVVRQAYEGVAEGRIEVLADEPTRQAKARLGEPAEEYYPAFHESMSLFLA